MHTILFVCAITWIFFKEPLCILFWEVRFHHSGRSTLHLDTSTQKSVIARPQKAEDGRTKYKTKQILC